MQNYRLPLNSIMSAVIAIQVASYSQAPRLTISVNPNVEFLSILESLSSDANGAFVNTPYADYIEEFSQTLNGSKSFELLKTMRLAGASRSDLYQFIVQLGNYPELGERGSVPNLHVNNGALVVPFIASLEADAKKLSLNQVLKLQQAKFNNAVTVVNIAGDWSQLMSETNSFFGTNTLDYRIYITGLSSSSLISFTQYTTDNPFSAVILPVSCLSHETNPNYESRYAVTIAGTGFANNQLTHAFDGVKDRLNKHFVWYEYVPDDIHYLPVSNWNDAIRESISAVTATAILSQFDEWSSSALKRNVLAEFPWTKSLFPIATQYAQNKSTARNTDDYVKRLLDELDRLRPVLKGGEPVDLGLDDVGLTDRGLPVGIVKPGSAAAKVGIKSGDLVQSIGGVAINGSESYLKAWAKWEKATESDAIPFRIKRGKYSFVVTIIMRTVGGKFDHFVRKTVK